VNEVRSELGKKPVEGGDENVIVTTKEVQPVCRLMELADEQRQQTQTAIQQAQAQLEMTKVQVDKAKNPPAPPPIPNTPQQQEQPSESPPHAKQGNAKQNTKDEGNQEGKEAQERYVCDLQNAVSHVTEILTRADEHLRMIRMQEAGIPQPVQVVIQTNETSRIDAPHNDTNEPTEPSQPIANDVLSEGNRDRPAMLQQHTGMMVAFMLDPDVASQLALPGGEDPADLHVTLAFLGDMGDTMPEGKLHPVQTLDNLKDVLSGFAERMQPLSGKPGGIGRFINAHTDVTPVIAHVNAPGLQDWRRQLVETLEAASYRVHDDFDYLPHLTLAYIPDDAPMPVDTIPTDVYFSFDTLCLTIGDDRYYFKIGGNDSGDGMHVESTIEETKKPAIAARNEWCPPSSTQLALEKDLAKAIKSYISKAKATKDGVTLPDETAHDHLHEALLDALSKAVNEGRHIALGTHEESMVSAAKNLAGRAVEVISDIVTQIKAKAKDLIDSIFGDDDVNPDDAQQVLDDQIEQWADEYSDMVAQTEVHAAVEGAVLDEMQQAGVGKMRWLAEPDACEMCRELAESGAIDTTDEWSGGITSPPAHPNCKCQVGMVEEN
jgi:2'-5' RNA ligase